MRTTKAIRKIWQHWLENERIELSKPDAPMHLALVGLITGFLAGGVIIIFRKLVETIQQNILPNTSELGEKLPKAYLPENYEALDTINQFLLPALGGVLLALLFYFYSARVLRVLGVAKVIDRLTYHQGYFSWRGFILQFFGAAIAIICGHSVGREGPHVYLGASISSLFAQSVSLPNNSMRTMVACGAAAGIAASFNTPLAGVLFALEVVMMEFSIASFIPIMLASVVATGLSTAVFGSEPAFDIDAQSLDSLKQLPIIIVLGVSVGAVAALMNHMLENISKRTRHIEIWWKLCAAGVIAGTLSIFNPEIMSIGYDTLDTLLRKPETYMVTALISLVAFKLVATSCCIGLGVPAGMIGPAFIIGAAIGAIAGITVSFTEGWQTSHIAFYAILGMGAMVGASLQAPLAALTAIIELTYNPGVIMPGMLTIIAAQLTSRVVFKKESLFITMLRSNEQDYQINPVSQTLQHIGVASVLKKSFTRSTRVITRKRAEDIIKSHIEWIILSENSKPTRVFPTVDLAKYLSLSTEDLNEIDLINIPGGRLHIDPISLQKNLYEAHQKFEAGSEALFVVFKEDEATDQSRIYGILVPEMVAAAYRI